MGKIIILFIYLVAATSFAKGPEFRQIVLQESLQKLEVGKSGPEDILKILGKPASVERKSQFTEVLFYNLNGGNYDTVLTVQNDKLLKIYQNQFKKKHVLNDFEKVLSPNQMQGAFLKASRQMGHSKGRSFIIEDMKQSFSAKFSSKKPFHLEEYEVWQEGSPKP